MILLVLIFTIPTLMFVCLCSLLGMWLALGPMNLVVRIPAFLLGNLALGFVLCLADTKSIDFLHFLESRHALTYAFGVILLATSLARRTLVYVRIPAFLLGAERFAALVRDTELGNLDIRWIWWLAMRTSFLAGVVATLARIARCQHDRRHTYI